MSESTTIQSHTVYILLAMVNYTFRNVDFAFMAILDHLVSLLNEYQE